MNEDQTTTAQLHREIGFVKDSLIDKVDARHREMLAAAELVNEKLEAISQRINVIEAARVEYKADTKDRVEAALAAQEKAVDAALNAADKATTLRADQLAVEFHEHLTQYRHETDIALASAHKATEAAFAASEKAISKAESANEKRFEGVNEFRQTLSDQAQLFMPRTEAIALSDRNTERIQDITDRLNLIQGQAAGSKASYSAIGTGIAALAALVVIVNILLAYALR